MPDPQTDGGFAEVIVNRLKYVNYSNMGIRKNE